MKMFAKSLLLAGSMLAFGGISAAKTCELSIEGNDLMAYNKNELTVEEGCTEVKIVLKHVGKANKMAMGHNVVVVPAKDYDRLKNAGAKAGPSADYMPKDPAIVAATKMIGGGETAEVTFKKDELKKGQEYKYFCSFPGHSFKMVGDLKVKWEAKGA